MKEHNDAIKDLIDLIKEGAKNFGLLDNMNLQEVLTNEKINDSFENLKTILIPTLLLDSVNAEVYDEIFQGVLNNHNIRFFQDLEILIQNARNKDKEKTNNLISRFLHIQAINNLTIPVGRKLTSKMLMDEEILDDLKQFQNGETEVMKFFEYFGSILSSVKEKTDRLLKIPRRLKQEVESYINTIKNHYETIRYVVGLFLGLFDILDNTSMRLFSWYFSKKKSPPLLYYRPKYYKGLKFWLQDYLDNPKFAKKFFSIKYLFESGVFIQLKDVRIHSAHSQIDIQQNKLQEGKYIIEVDRDLKEFTLNEIEDLEKNSYIFILWTKHLIARQFYSNNMELVNYLLQNY